jgi:zinc protease
VNRRGWASWCVWMLLCALAHAEDPVLPRLLEGDLENGLHVVVCPRAAEGRVVVRLTLGVGHYDDGEGDARSDLLARTFVATWRAERAQLAPLAAAVSARETALTVGARQEELPAVFDALASLLTRADFADPIVAEQKAELLRDLANAARSADGDAASLFADVGAPGHPGRFTSAQRSRAAGAVDEASALQLRTARAVPGNAVLVVVGDGDPGATLRLARTAFQGWARAALPEPTRPTRPLPEASARLIAHDARASAGCALTLGWRVAIPTQDDVAVHDVLASLLAEGPQARVPSAFPQARVIDDARDEAFAAPGAFAWAIDVAGSMREDAIAKLTQMGVDLGRSGPTQAELDRARNRVRMRWSVVADRQDLLAARLASDRLWRGDARALDADLRRLDALTIADVRDAAARWLRPEAVVVVAKAAAAPRDRAR